MVIITLCLLCLCEVFLRIETLVYVSKKGGKMKCGSVRIPVVYVTFVASFTSKLRTIRSTWPSNEKLVEYSGMILAMTW
jgi:hypothetical protein